MRTFIFNATLITPYRLVQCGGLSIENGKIIEVFEAGLPSTNPGDAIIDAQGLYLAPGFIDIHTHGAGNADFMDGSEDAVCTVCRTHMYYGTTSIVPSTLTCTPEELTTNLDLITQAMRFSDHMPEILGIHLEGPYFSPEQKGAQDPRYLKIPDPEEYSRILDKFPAIIRWTVAPELPGALEMGRYLSERSVLASIGHSNAIYDEIVAACENGYSFVTHLFCGMSRLTRKNARMFLGVAESSLLLDELDVEIIADGEHLPPSLLKLIYKVKGPDHICLVTDSIRAAGLVLEESILGSINPGLIGESARPLNIRWIKPQPVIL